MTPGLSVPAGVYLPVTAVLGGRLFVTAEGYEEAVRDVVRLCADVPGLLDQVKPCWASQPLSAPLCQPTIW